MPVNQDGTSAGDELLEAFNDQEQQPTDDVEELEGEEPVEEGEEDGDEDADLDPDAEEDEAEEGEDDGTQTHTVKVNGQEERVTLNELKAGYMKDADYRQKTAALAKDKERVSATEKQFESGLTKLGEDLELVATFIASQINLDEAALDKLAEENPAELVKVQRQLAKQGSALQAAHQRLQHVRNQQANEAQRKLNEFRDAEVDKLHQVAPEFSKPETVQRLHSYLKDTYGLKQEEIESVLDHRFALIADKARRFDAIKSKASLKEKQVKNTPAKFQKGGAMNRGGQAMKEKNQAFQTVMKSGKTDALAKLF
ncbi:hypothetical protein [Agrobacterium tumefaciens]|uniref:Scaffolding protein n=1 Tax=Agrobacterium tumefaciens TaxID=358 RepID=A0A176WXS7_AGRTU|nr:hypothetical protein [Agrobacterium tumefaciens]OAE37646.1 hypothetical protein A7J57_08695 [Agrobacterium tumefaciens]